MLVAMWNCHSWWLYVSSNVKCHSGLLDVSTGGVHWPHRFICQVLCTGIQGISALVLGSPLAKEGCLPNLSSLAVLLWYWGVSRGLHLTWLYNANWLYYPYSQIKWNSHLFLKSKMAAKSSHNIYPMMHLGGRSVSRSRSTSSNCHSWPLDVNSNVKLPFLTTRCQ